ncbi:MFS transporter [Terriglobus saanensis]|uniref:Major facilitator superfamily MFS_1 n=1 Tax=Terriglobus saanensis (strain ATCC BAA-1853 / DSM 23119 / SP1PR4) TaxID=401053 RepID=E8UX03_TERSS|nr:major facilitator superfamily MFS_1 [Terriglobus saanensis SP1PR4]
MIERTSAGVPRRRWRIAWLLGLGVLVNYFDRVNLSVSHEALYTTFGISTVTFGYLSGAYNWTYAMCQLPVGVILDRFGIKRVGRVSSFLWSLASFGAATTPGIGGFFAARFLLGVGEAPTFPANAKAIGKWFPKSERSFATAIFDAAAKFASAIGVPVIGLILLKVGWRWSFALTGVVSVLYFGLFWLVYRDPEDDPKLTNVERDYIADDVPITAVEERASLGALLRQRKVIAMVLGFGSYNYVFYLLLTWLPTYLSSALHIDLMHSFLYTGVPWLFATVTDLIVGGWLVDALIRRGWDANRVRKVILIGGTACGLGILGAAYAHTPMRALIWISISIGGLAAAAPVGWSMPSLIAPKGSVGTVGGIVNLSNQISGISAPIITGYLVAARHNFAWAFGVSAVYLLIGIAAYLFLLGRIEPMDVETTTV